MKINISNLKNLFYSIANKYNIEEEIEVAIELFLKFLKIEFGSLLFFDDNIYFAENDDKIILLLFYVTIIIACDMSNKSYISENIYNQFLNNLFLKYNITNFKNYVLEVLRPT